MVRSCKNIHETKGARVPAFVRIGKTRTSARIASACCCCSVVQGGFWTQATDKIWVACASLAQSHARPSKRQARGKEAGVDGRAGPADRSGACRHSSERACWGALHACSSRRSCARRELIRPHVCADQGPAGRSKMAGTAAEKRWAGWGDDSISLLFVMICFRHACRHMHALLILFALHAAGRSLYKRSTHAYSTYMRL